MKQRIESDDFIHHFFCFLPFHGKIEECRRGIEGKSKGGEGDGRKEKKKIVE